MKSVPLRVCSTLFVACLLVPGAALALGEVFKVETTGTEFCGHFDATKFSAKNNVDFWVRIDSTEQITLSLTPNFAPGTTFPMFGFTYQTGAAKAAFVAGIVFESGGFATIQGSASFDQDTGLVRKLKGRFIQSEIAYEGCFSSGKFTTQP